MSLSDILPGTLSEAQQTRRATAKPQPHQLAKAEKKLTKKQREEAFRSAVWLRDKSHCRATGKPLLKAHLDDERAGEVDHAYPRSTSPERIYDVENGILLQRKLHRLRKAACQEMPEHRVFSYAGPDDRGQPQTFTVRSWRTGKVLWTRVG